MTDQELEQLHKRASDAMDAAGMTNRERNLAVMSLAHSLFTGIAEAEPIDSDLYRQIADGIAMTVAGVARREAQ